MNTNYLKYLMSRNGDTQKEISNLLGISQNSLINKMTGKTYFTMREVRLIVERYDLDFREIKKIFFWSRLHIRFFKNKILDLVA